MSKEQILNSRLQLKTDTPENWAKATGFIPKKGEPIIYQDGKSSQLKIGDGSTVVTSLPFVLEIQAIPVEAIEALFAEEVAQ